MSNSLIIKNIHISNFKAYKPCSFSENDVNKISFQDVDDEYFRLMILSGFNGYGKTTIFQAVEFALSGKIDLVDYKDKNKKFEENVIINDLDRDSIIAIEFINVDSNEIKTLIRYAEEGKAGKYIEYAKGYKAYIYEGEFNYNQFIDMLKKNKIKNVTKSEIQNLINENNIDEWINENYIKQDFTSNIIFKKDSDRVNFINSFVELTDKKNLNKLMEEIDNRKEVKDALEKDIKTINTEINKIKLVQTQEINNEILNLEEHSLWDKEEYNDDEDFTTYINKIKSLRTFYIDLNNYTDRYKKEIVDYLVNNKNEIKYTLIAGYSETRRKNYINGFNRREYLKKIISSKDNFFKTEIKEQYFTSELKDTIEKIRNDKNELDAQSNEKENIYNKLKEVRLEIGENSNDFKEVFKDTCPLCGHNYSSEKNGLLDCIKQYNELFIQCDTVLRKGINQLNKSIDDRYSLVKTYIEKEIKSLNYDNSIKNYITDINGNNLRKYIDYKEKIEFVLNEAIVIEDKEINSDNINNKYNDILSKIQILKNELDKKFTIFVNEGYNEAVYKENEKYCIQLNKKEDVTYTEKISNKLKYLQWRKHEKDLVTLTKNKEKLNLKKEEYRNILIENKKIEKLIKAIKDAQKKYLKDIVKYIEIPLYIYSGKLIQTHQNGLGIFCYTGSEDDKLTQFKLTTNGKPTGHDIVNKFSSGQKAVINISIMLAFRKVIQSNLNIFMIDDPCQSMDDINIASLTEILKNEFSDTQLIISTHEEDVAGYIKYKFNKSGKKARNFNVQKELYNTKIH
ncbi:AAA family ATPase [Clostridium butyricum]|uniref:AAA family ATPase n=1 Tax=Clostridium butyricum TaxID=1492 RepID=UPI002107E0F7|nr:AAA family ATPase [Clostridium butyricum]MCQ2013499.1 AAA family ATPase [Clostridium butyricum]MCQ2025716.1 AAA family ATPase [Clostridium butyricum]